MRHQAQDRILELTIFPSFNTVAARKVLKSCDILPDAQTVIHRENAQLLHKAHSKLSGSAISER